MGVTLATGPGFAPPAGSVAGMDATKMRSKSASRADWKKKRQEARKKGTQCEAGNCTNKVGDPGVKSLAVEHKFPAALIWNYTKNKQTVNQIGRHFTNPKNLMLLCPRCNSSKGGKTYRQWAADNPNLISQQRAAQLQQEANAFRDMLLKL